MIGNIFSLSTGRFLRKFEVSSQELFDMQAQNNEISFDGGADPETKYIDFTGTEPVVANQQSYVIVSDKTDVINDLLDVAILTLPDPCFITVNGGPASEVVGGVFQFSSADEGNYIIALVGRYTGQIEIHVHNLVNLKEQVKGKITTRYGQALYGGFAYNGNMFDSDETSMNLISGSASEAGRNPLPVGFAWKTQDNQFVAMGQVDIEGLSAAMFNHINMIFAVKESKKAALVGLVTLNDVLAFDVNAGW